MSERNVHFYHVYAIDGWLPIVHEHLDNLYKTDLVMNLTEFHVGVVGPHRSTAASYIFDHIPCKIAAEAEEGWENTTLRAMWRWSQNAPDSDVLYTHTKGVANPAERQDEWRRAMDEAVTVNWRDALERLEGHDAAGWHWMNEHEHFEHPIFAGNFWWAKSSVLKGLRQPRNDYRFAAEAWLGENGVTDVVDLSLQET